MPASFGTTLKEWRNRRHISQLDLGLSADVSSRHISFLETGRARPSRAMVLRLCENLDIPLSARNHLLTAAGMAPIYANRAFSDAEMQPIHAAVRWMLDRHAPYPAFAINRHWAIQDMNRPAALMFGAVGIGTGDNLIDALASNPQLRAALENLDEVLRLSILRLRTESSHLGGDPILDAGADRLAAGAGQVPAQDDVLPAVIPARYRLQDHTLSLFSTIAQFGTAEDIALSELRIEMLFPADEPTRATLIALDATPTSKQD